MEGHNLFVLSYVGFFLVATSLCSVELRGVSLNVRMYSKTGDHQQEDSVLLTWLYTRYENFKNHFIFWLPSARCSNESEIFCEKY